MSLDVTKTMELTQKEQGMFTDFLQWVQNYNEYILNAWQEKSTLRNDDDDSIIVDGLSEIELDEGVV